MGARSAAATSTDVAPRTSAALYPSTRNLNLAQPAWVAFDKQVCLLS